MNLRALVDHKADICRLLSELGTDCRHGRGGRVRIAGTRKRLGGPSRRSGAGSAPVTHWMAATLGGFAGAVMLPRSFSEKAAAKNSGEYALRDGR